MMPSIASDFLPFCCAALIKLSQHLFQLVDEGFFGFLQVLFKSRFEIVPLRRFRRSSGSALRILFSA